MASTDAYPTFEASFSALVQHLQESICKRETITIPDDIVQPFKRASRPIDGTLIRPLLKVFDGSKQHNVIKLDPKSFAGIVSIAFHFPHSIAQEKLLYIFLSIVRHHKNQNEAANALKKCSLPVLNITQLNERYELLSKRLLHTILRRLVSDGIDKRLRWIAAQFISVLIYEHKASRDLLSSYAECQHFHSLLVDLDDYVTRFLIADIIRELCAHDATIEDFFSPSTAIQSLLGFPKSTKSDAAWLSTLQDFFSSLDAATASNRIRQTALKILEVTYDNDKRPIAFDGGIGIIDERFVLLSATSTDYLQLASLPMLSDPRVTASISEDQRNVLNIAYNNDAGYQLQNGTKHALSNISLTLSSSDEATTVLDSVLGAQKLPQDLTPEAVKGPPSNRKSIALLNLWTHEPSLQNGSSEAKETQSTELNEEVSSPLQQLSQRHFEDLNGPDPRDKPNVDDTASEDSFLGAQQDKSSLKNKLVTAQDTPTHIKKALAFSDAADKAVERSRSRSRMWQPPAAVSTEGATDVESHLPWTQTPKSGPPVPIFEDSEQPPTKNKSRARAGSAFVSSPLPPFPAPKPHQPSKRRPFLKTPTTQDTALFQGPGSKKTRDRDSMARPAATQPRAADKEKNGSQAFSGLKRKAQPAAKARQAEDSGWDESFREEGSFDIPEDDSQDERPTKKAKAQVGKTSINTNAASKSKPRSSKPPKQTKPTKRTVKKAVSKPAARLQEQADQTTMAVTRQRRTVNKTTTYEESSSSSIREASAGVEEKAPTMKSSSRLVTSKPSQPATKAPQAVHNVGDKIAQEPSSPAPDRNLGIADDDEASMGARVRADVPKSPPRAEPEARSHMQVQHPAIATDATQDPPAVLLDESGPTQVEVRQSGGGAQASCSTAKITIPRVDAPGNGLEANQDLHQVKNAKTKMVVESADADQQTAEDSHLTTKDRAHPDAQDTNGQEDVAHDSHPAAAVSNATAQKVFKNSFGTTLNVILETTFANKENIPHQPATPLGDTKRFVNDVDAAESNPLRTVSSQRKGACSVGLMTEENAFEDRSDPEKAVNLSTPAKSRQTASTPCHNKTGESNADMVEELVNPIQNKKKTHPNLEFEAVLLQQAKVSDDEVVLSPETVKKSAEVNAANKPRSEPLLEHPIQSKEQPPFDDQQGKEFYPQAQKKASRPGIALLPLSMKIQNASKGLDVDLGGKTKRPPAPNESTETKALTRNEAEYRDSHMPTDQIAATATTSKVIVLDIDDIDAGVTSRTTFKEAIEAPRLGSPFTPLSGDDNDQATHKAEGFVGPAATTISPQPGQHIPDQRAAAQDEPRNRRPVVQDKSMRKSIASARTPRPGSSRSSRRSVLTSTSISAKKTRLVHFGSNGPSIQGLTEVERASSALDDLRVEEPYQKGTQVVTALADEARATPQTLPPNAHIEDAFGQEEGLSEPGGEAFVEPGDDAGIHTNGMNAQKTQKLSSAQRLALVQTSSPMFPRKEVSEAQQQSALVQNQSNTSERSSELLVESTSSEAPEDQDSAYENSGSEGSAEDNARADPTPGVKVKILPGNARSSPKLEDESTVKLASKPQPQISNRAPRTSIGLGNLVMEKHPEAEATILANRSKPAHAIEPIAENNVRYASEATAVAAPNDTPASQKLMPPPKRSSTMGRLSKGRQSSRSKSNAVPTVSGRPVRQQEAPIRTKIRRAIQPLRINPSKSLPAPAIRTASVPSSTPEPFYLRLDQDLSVMAASDEAPVHELPQRRSYTADDGADSTLVEALDSSDQSFRRRREMSESSDDSYSLGYENSRAGPGLDSDQRPETNVFAGLQQNIRIAFLQMAENALLRLYDQQTVIERQVEMYETAGAGAVEEMSTVWASKVPHESRKVREQIEENKVVLEETAQSLGEENDWATNLQIKRVGKMVEERAKEMEENLQSFRQKYGI